jgi:ribosomal protein S18 acetylase RimI-like enzyme
MTSAELPAAPAMAAFRRARETDLPVIVRLLAEDSLGRSRERYGDGLAPGYLDAFAAIDRDPAQLLAVAELECRVIGCMQLTFIPHLTYQGGRRLQIEGVRVDRSVRSRGIGEAMFRWAIEQAREGGCHLVQLTTNRARDDAQRFYQRLGFEPSHIGYKLHLAG